EEMTHTELAWEFADLFGELAPDQINEMLAKNVPMDMLQFFTDYARTFAEREEVGDAMQKRIPNLMLLGYLLRLLEERVIDAEDIGHAGGLAKMKRVVFASTAPTPVGPYSQAIVAGGFVFASGQIPLDPASGKLVEGEIEVQAERVLQNLRAVLEAGRSPLDRRGRRDV